MPTQLPRTRILDDQIFPGDIAAAIMGLRFDKIVSLSWEFRPSVGIVAKDVQRLGLDIRSFKEPLTRIVKQVMIPSFKKNFKEGGRPPWTPLAASTIAARKYSAWPILVRTGRLQKRATQFNIWSIGAQSATIRALPSDAFYGVYHQAGSETLGGPGIVEELMSHVPGSSAANALIAKFVPKAQKELGPNAGVNHVHNRAVGLLLDSEENPGWHLPARPFIMYQDDDVPKMEAIFATWMEERAIRVGRFRRE